jgi:hypothetical protein
MVRWSILEDAVKNHDLKYFSYVSRAKVKQLHDQLSDFSVGQRTSKRTAGASGGVELGANALFGFLKSGFRADANSSRVIEEVGQKTVVQQLMEVMQHIKQNERVLDLAELCTRQEGVSLDAFAYVYSGRFFALGDVGREDKYGGITITESALARAGDEIIISKSLLIKPARDENAFKETGPNRSALVSRMCMLVSCTGSYTLNLACSLKYFGDMGGSWNERDQEWDVHPHSGNHHFFSGDTDAWFDALLFVNGVRGKTIMGSPLCLAYGSDPETRI